MKTSLLVAVSAISLLWGDAALAQRAVDPQADRDSLTPLTLNTPIQSALTQGSHITPRPDPVIYADYALTLAKDQSVRIDLTTSVFDAYLELYSDGQKGAEPLAYDDDGGPQGMDARLRFTAEEAGLYIVRVRPFDGTEGGQYVLTVTEPVARDYPAGPTVVMGNDLSGRLDGNSALSDDEERYAPYSWTARAGERVAISLASSDFDPLLKVGQIRNGRFAKLAENDDGPEGLDSYLVFTAPAAGTYYVMAMSMAADAEGEYQLRFSEPPEAARSRPISFDQKVNGRLTDQSGVGFASQKADQFRFSGRAGQRISATLTSNDFDAYLELYDADGGTLATDDDSGGNLNARLIHRLDKDGDYILEARGLSDATGRYDLELKLVPPPPAPVAIQFGQTLQGELKSSSGVDDAGHAYGGYTFDGRKDQRVQVNLRSGDFDAMTELGLHPADGEDFKVLESDDDGLMQGTDSRLNFILPEDGRYEVRALGLAADSTGLYSIELVDRGPEPKPGSLLVPSVARGSLSDLDSLTDEGQSYDAYEFKTKADEKLRFSVISATFDAMVEVGELNDGDWRSIEVDDDGLSGNHARLDWTAPRDGTYQVRVRGYRPGSSGDYSLIVERQP